MKAEGTVGAPTCSSKFNLGRLHLSPTSDVMVNFSSFRVASVLALSKRVADLQRRPSVLPAKEQEADGEAAKGDGNENVRRRH
jgi:hypothetical protein